MHELGIVFHIIRTVEDVAKENHVARIQRVTLQLGEVSGVVESYLQDCWKWAAAKSEILPGAALTVEQIPAITLCEDCGQQYPTVPHGRTCPHCQSPYPPAAGQRDDDQRSGSRGAGDIRSFRLRKVPRTGCVMRPCAGIFCICGRVYAILETGIVKTERMNHSPCGRSTLNTAALHKTS